MRHEVYLNLVSLCRGPLLAVWVGSIREEFLQERVSTIANEVQQVLDKGILVLVRHPCDVVHDIPGIMPDQKLGSTGFKVWVARQYRRSLDEAVIRG